MNPTKEQLRKKRHQKIRKSIKGTANKPRLCVFRSNKEIYAQLINDESGVVIASSSSMKMKGAGTEKAKNVGLELSKAAKKGKIEECVFDRGGYLYHGRIKAVAEGAREGGLKF